MTFLHRRRSLNPSKEIFPSLPPPVENVPGRPFSIAGDSEQRPTSRPSRIIKRVSSIFSKRKRPSDLSLSHSFKVSAVEYSRPPTLSSLHSPTESEVSFDDIRRPSGLGRSVSISSNRSLPPSPSKATYDTSLFPAIGGGGGGYDRARAYSSPNLLQTLTRKLLDQRDPTYSRSPSNGSTFPRIPTEVLTMILSFASRQLVASLAPLSREFCTAARVALYRTLDVRTVRAARFEQLATLLATNQQIVDLVVTFICHSWPPFFSASRTMSRSRSASNLKKQPPPLPSRVSTLTSTFIVAFQRMHRLTTLVLPAFDLTLLQHHSAFGLRSITFLNAKLSSSEMAEMLGWLDGQTNVTSLVFPNLMDCPDATNCNGGNSIKYPFQTHTPGLNTQKDQVVLADTPTPTITSTLVTPSTTPLAESFPIPPAPLGFLYSSKENASSNTSMFTSPLLLPNLEVLQAPPSLVLLLCQPFTESRTIATAVDPLFTTMSTLAAPPIQKLRYRPLHTVRLNIHSTLYTGLRPGVVMSALKNVNSRPTVSRKNGPTGIPDQNQVTGVRCFGLKFGKIVDRRTVEKVLGAAGTFLGSNDGDGTHVGVEVLDIELDTAAFGPEEVLYKIIHTVLPRYRCLKSIRISPAPSPPSANLPRLSLSTNISRPVSISAPSTPVRPLPSIPPPLPSPPTSLMSSSSLSSVPPSATSVAFANIHLSTPQTSAAYPRNLPPALSDMESGYVTTWLKHCAGLERVVFFSGAEWLKVRDDGNKNI